MLQQINHWPGLQKYKLEFPDMIKKRYTIGYVSSGSSMCENLFTLI